MLPDNSYYRKYPPILLTLNSQIGGVRIRKMGISKPNVEKMRAGDDVIGLIKALPKSSDLRVLGAIEDALEDIGRRTTEPFVEALKDKDESVRRLAVMALGDIGDERAIDPISMVPTDDDEFLKEMVAEATEKIKSRY